jgi:hypothetical protein
MWPNLNVTGGGRPGGPGGYDSGPGLGQATAMISYLQCRGPPAARPGSATASLHWHTHCHCQARHCRAVVPGRRGPGPIILRASPCRAATVRATGVASPRCCGSPSHVPLLGRRDPNRRSDSATVAAADSEINDHDHYVTTRDADMDSDMDIASMCPRNTISARPRMFRPDRLDAKYLAHNYIKPICEFVQLS